MGAQTTYRGLTITAIYKGDTAWPANDGVERAQPNYNNHKVTVRNNARKVQCTFDFWASQMEPEVRKPSAVLSAFECFVSDAISGLQTFEEFCRDFGYDTDSRRAEKTWNACQKSAAKLKKVLGTGVDLYDFANELSEKVNA